MTTQNNSNKFHRGLLDAALAVGIGLMAALADQVRGDDAKIQANDNALRQVEQILKAD